MIYVHNYIASYLSSAKAFNNVNFHIQIFVVKCFRHFRELHRNHETFCHENFLTASLSTGRDTLKSQNND